MPGEPPPSPELDPPARRQPGSSSIKRAGVAVLGWTLVVVGVPLLVLPGPGLLVIAAGLAVLATEFPWAKRLLTRVRRRLGRADPQPPA